MRRTGYKLAGKFKGKDPKDKQAVSFLTEDQTCPWDSWQLQPLQKPKIQNVFGKL